MSGYQPQGYDPRQQPAATPPQWQQRGYPESMPPLQSMPPTAAESGQPQWQQQQPPYYPPQQYAPPRRKRHLGRKIAAGVVGLVAVIIVISVAANSGGHTVNTTGAATGGNSAGNAPKTAGVGSAITLAGDGSGERMSVTVVKVIATAAPGGDFSGAPAGDRLYAVQFRLRDTGSAAYSDAPDNGAAVVDSAGQSYQSAIDDAAGCQSFGGTENIAPGASGLGCVVFEVPKAAKIASVQFTLDSGMGPQTGQWNVKS